jgi:hypothetical protein
MGSLRIRYVPRHDASLQAELDALSNIFRFIVDCHAKRNAAELASKLGSHDVKKGEDAHTAARRVSQK